MRTSLLLALVIAASAAGAAITPARGQQQPPDLSNADRHKARGYLAWRRAVWTGGPGAFDRAIEELEGYERMGGSPDDVTVGFLLGLSYLQSRRSDAAKRVIGRAFAAAPGFVGFRLAEGIQLVNAQQEHAALARFDVFLERLDELDQDLGFRAELEFLGHFHRGRALYRTRDLEGSIEALERALELSEKDGRPPNRDVQERLARVHVRVNEFGVAENLLREILRADPDNAAVYFSLGVVAADQHRTEEARQWYERAAARRPGFPDPHVKLAYLAKERGDLVGMRTSLAAYEAAHRRFWTDTGETPKPRVLADIASGLGEYWELVGRKRQEADDEEGAVQAFERARAAYERALEATDGCVRPLFRLIQLGAELGRPAKELDDLKRLLRRIQKEEDGAPSAIRSTFCQVLKTLRPTGNGACDSTPNASAISHASRSNRA